MHDISDLDNLLGKTVSQAVTLHHPDLPMPSWVALLVDSLWLVVGVDADTDEVLLSLLPESNFRQLAQGHSLSQISNQHKSIASLWRMTNSRGYDDGFQVEFDDLPGTTLQLTAEAAQLRLTIFQRF